ncbi:MAG TPA: hypothetical protein VJ141_02820 [Candidatus Limnocylindrales bacterium]|nr:hypothetical protein [Candidatus Limnocylindrales bacterium]
MARRFMPRLAVAVSTAAVVLSLSASAVFAGEITGNGTRVHPEGEPLPGKSLCAYSGQNDEYHEVSTEEPRVQSWGQIPKAVRDSLPDFLHPGMACNPTIGLEE